jgi:NADP-dependent 3-hydroxy acid dehydrogenase YdfG
VGARHSSRDVTRAAEQEALVRAAVERFGALDFAHNNAGVELQALLTATAEPDWDLVIDVNVKGVWLGLKAQIPQMIAQGGGAIVNTSSLA